MVLQLDHKEGSSQKNWYFWTVVLEKILKSPLDYKVSKPVNPKGNRPWIFIGRTDAEAEIPILWPADAKSWLIGKDSDAGKDWGQEKGTTEDEMVGWPHWLNGHEFEQARGAGEGQTGKASLLQPMGSQRVGHDWVTEQQTGKKLPRIPLLSFQHPGLEENTSPLLWGGLLLLSHISRVRLCATP